MLVTAPDGQQFLLDMTMSPSKVYLPCKSVWHSKAPDWGFGLWEDLHDNLANWCKGHQVIFVVDTPDDSRVWFGKT